LQEGGGGEAGKWNDILKSSLATVGRARGRLGFEFHRRNEKARGAGPKRRRSTPPGAKANIEGKRRKVEATTDNGYKIRKKKKG